MLFREEGEENYNVESKNETTSIKVKHQKAKDLFTTTSAATEAGRATGRAVVADTGK